MLLLCPSSSSFSNQVSLCNFLVPSSLHSILRVIERAVPWCFIYITASPSLSVPPVCLIFFYLPRVRIGIVESLVIQKFFRGRKLSQDRFYIVLSFFTYLLRWELLFLLIHRGSSLIKRFPWSSRQIFIFILWWYLLQIINQSGLSWLISRPSCLVFKVILDLSHWHTRN